jgi:hypothetical protein
MYMKTEQDLRKHKRRGPRKRGYEHVHILLPPDIIEWAKAYPDGMGAFIRNILIAEHERRCSHPPS